MESFNVGGSGRVIWFSDDDDSDQSYYGDYIEVGEAKHETMDAHFEDDGFEVHADVMGKRVKTNYTMRPVGDFDWADALGDEDMDDFITDMRRRGFVDERGSPRLKATSPSKTEMGAASELRLKEMDQKIVELHQMVAALSRLVSLPKATSQSGAACDSGTSQKMISEKKSSLKGSLSELDGIQPVVVKQKPLSSQKSSSEQPVTLANSKSGADRKGQQKQN
jgi:hypothetical protein